MKFNKEEQRKFIGKILKADTPNKAGLTLKQIFGCMKLKHSSKMCMIKDCDEEAVSIRRNFWFCKQHNEELEMRFK